jgi:NAD(P)-dependent dehydrogenase (short-subunit alcohol dehydrogenase family)
MPTALITGASRGLGLALARELAARRWNLVIDAREPVALDAALEELSRSSTVTAIAGDVSDEAHRRTLVEAAGPRLDVLVNNASVLGPTPLPRLVDYPQVSLERVFRINAFAPLRLVQLALPLLAEGGRIVNLTSDAAVEAYESWGGYGASKAALEHLTGVLAAEHPELRIYAVDPGDMRTQMQQDAFPGEDISDRLPPEESVPGLLALIEGEAPSGRYLARDLARVGA